MNNTGLLIRKAANGISLFYDEDNVEALALCAAESDDSLRLKFKVFSKDRYFSNYTEPARYREGSILYFDNHKKAVVDTKGRFRLHSGEYVSELDFEHIGSPRADEALNYRDGCTRSFFVVEIGISREIIPPLSEQEFSVLDYYIKFDTKQTIWKYYLLGSVARKDAYISSPNDKVEFENTGRELLAERKTALTFRSKQLIPLRKEPDCRFQLREKASGNGKILIKRLPIASTTQIYREMVGGKEVLISEIYVNC